MNLRALHYFVQIAHHGSISQAALHLHVAQPALSRQIHNLEEDLGVRLLTRTAQTVSERMRRSFKDPSSHQSIRWFEERRVEANAQTFDASAFGRAVALITLRYTPRPDPATALKRGQLFHHLLSNLK